MKKKLNVFTYSLTRGLDNGSRNFIDRYDTIPMNGAEEKWGEL